MIVTNTFGVEQYRRIFFRDIEAYTIRRTAQGFIVNVVLGVLFAGFIAAAIGFSIMDGTADTNRPTVIIFGVISILPLVFLLINSLFLGPTGIVCIQTAAGVEELPAPKRVRRATWLIRRLAPKIVALQADIDSSLSTPTAYVGTGVTPA